MAAGRWAGRRAGGQIRSCSELWRLAPSRVGCSSFPAAFYCGSHCWRRCGGGGGGGGVGLRRKRELVKLEEKGKVEGKRERTWDVLIFKF